MDRASNWTYVSQSMNYQILPPQPYTQRTGEVRLGWDAPLFVMYEHVHFLTFAGGALARCCREGAPLVFHDLQGASNRDSKTKSLSNEIEVQAILQIDTHLLALHIPSATYASLARETYRTSAGAQTE